jgi:hypothetical protein
VSDGVPRAGGGGAAGGADVVFRLRMTAKSGRFAAHDER